MSDDQMELENLEEEVEVPEEEEEVEKEEAAEPIKPARKSSRRSSKSRSSITSELSDDSKEVKSATSEAAGPTVEAYAPLEVSQNRVNVRSLWPARLIVRGAPSDEVYEWPNAGALVSVNSVDVGFLLSKNKAAEVGCCGGGPRNYFELA